MFSTKKNIGVGFVFLCVAIILAPHAAFALPDGTRISSSTTARPSSLPADPPKPAVSAVLAYSVLTDDLHLGSKGEKVVALQTVLEENGYLKLPTGTKKGYFGELTRLALIKFQKANGVKPANGYFGPRTRMYFLAKYPLN